MRLAKTIKQNCHDKGFGSEIRYNFNAPLPTMFGHSIVFYLTENSLTLCLLYENTRIREISVVLKMFHLRVLIGYIL